MQSRWQADKAGLILLRVTEPVATWIDEVPLQTHGNADDRES
jgi:hypothetical protein